MSSWDWGRYRSEEMAPTVIRGVRIRKCNCFFFNLIGHNSSVEIVGWLFEVWPLPKAWPRPSSVVGRKIKLSWRWDQARRHGRNWKRVGPMLCCCFGFKIMSWAQVSDLGFVSDQGGRRWQPFGKGKNGHKTFVRGILAIFVTNA